MSKKMLIDANYPGETRVVVLNRYGAVDEIEYQTSSKPQIKGNIFLAKVTRIEPSLQAAFIDYGNGKNGFLPFSEIHSNYYNIPASDRDEGSNLTNLKEITPPKITSDDMEESSVAVDDLYEEPELSSVVNNVTKALEDEAKEAAEAMIATDEEDGVEEAKNEPAKEYKIQEVIKHGQILLVQAQKEERGNKGASFTTLISLAGKYCVLMPNKAGNNGISKRISSYDERKRLRDVVSKLGEQEDSDSSVILRTAGIGRTSYEIKRDYDYLVRLWNKIREITISSKAPAFIHSEESIIQKALRDMMDSKVEEVLVQGNEAFSVAHEFINNIQPSEAKKVKQYNAKTPLFTKFKIEEQLSALYQPIAELPSGGYIVINPTEALISVDVNSGKLTSERNIEETAVKTNLEAAKEVARQLRLRDLSGLVVIDFIDMYDSKNRRIVERTLREYIKQDKAKIHMSAISSFGLLEMSRQRLRSSFLEANSVMCPQCSGKGVIRANESNVTVILRTLENEIFKGGYASVNLYASMSAILYLANNKRNDIAFLEKKYNIKINLVHDHEASADSFSIEKLKSVEQQKLPVAQRPALLISSSLFDGEEVPASSKNRKKWGKKGEKKGENHTEKKPDDVKPEENMSPEKVASDKELPEKKEGEENDAAPKRRRAPRRRKVNKSQEKPQE